MIINNSFLEREKKNGLTKTRVIIKHTEKQTTEKF